MIRTIALTLAFAISVATSASAQILKKEPAMGRLMPGQRVLVDDGSCGAGKIKEVVGGDHTAVGGEGSSAAQAPLHSALISRPGQNTSDAANSAAMATAPCSTVPSVSADSPRAGPAPALCDTIQKKSSLTCEAVIAPAPTASAASALPVSWSSPRGRRGSAGSCPLP